MSDDPASTRCYERFLEETRDVSPANLLIKIESFSLFSNNGIDKYESRPFEAGGYKWELIISPDGIENEKDDCHVSVYFSIAEIGSLAVGWEVNAVFAFFVYDQLMDNYLCFRGTTWRFNALVPKWGFSRMISKKSLIDPSKGYLVNDSCVFGAEVFVIKPQRINECLSIIKDTSSHKRDWRISNFSKLVTVWNSEEFDAGNHKWKVLLHPRGDARAKGLYIPMYLECVDAINFSLYQKVKVGGFIRIKSKLNNFQHSKEIDNWYTSSSTSWGYYVMDSSKGFFADDCWFLELEFSVTALLRDAPNI